MPVYDTLKTLFEQNLWANVRLFAVCAELSEAQLATNLVGGYGSIRDTLQHIVTSERSYLHRIKTGQPYPRSPEPPKMSLDEMLTAIRASGEGLIAAAPLVNGDQRVMVDWQGTPRPVPIAIFFTQAINHATEHRVHIMTTLTQLGIQPPNLDGWRYFEACEGGA